MAGMCLTVSPLYLGFSRIASLRFNSTLGNDYLRLEGVVRASRRPAVARTRCAIAVSSTIIRPRQPGERDLPILLPKRVGSLTLT